MMEAAALTPLETLSSDEVRALSAAAAWYAKRHERMISELADDTSASAQAQRDRYLILRSALGKLGINLPLPDGIPHAS